MSTFNQLICFNRIGVAFKIKSVVLVPVFLLLFNPVYAQVIESEPKPPLTRILFVMDASQSMYARWQSDMKINIAKRIMSNLLDSLMTAQNLDLALRLYGHQHRVPPQVCNDTRLVVPFGGSNNIRNIKQQINNLTPRGTTPIAYALEQAASDFPPCDHCRNIIILITDGIEECGGDPCAVSQHLQKQGIVLRPFVIGIGRDFSDAFDCVGTYFDATNEADFSKALNVVISQALNSTTLQVNLLDEKDKATETNVSMTFFDDFSGRIKYNYVHTMNERGFPDTLLIDPLLTYNIVVHTIPPVVSEKVELTPGKHTTIGIKTPQGTLDLKMESRDRIVRELKCIVRKHGKMETLHVQNFGQSENYITGLYDLEVLTLPRIYIPNVEIKQSHTTTVEIPMPGIAVIEKTAAGYGGLYLEKDNKLELVYNFKENSPERETIVLQPGKYRVIYRSKFVSRSFYTTENRFTVDSGKTTNVRLFR